MSNPKRILHIVSAMNRGGTETLLMNIYRNVDREKVQFDFVSHRQEACHYDRDIESLGGKVFRIPSLGQVGPVSYIKQLHRILTENSYIAVHSHTDYQSGFATLAAKLAGIKIRACHSHSNSWLREPNIKQNITLSVLKSVVRWSATDYCACSFEAARFLFGQRLLDKNRIHIFKNGIEVRDFKNEKNSCIQDLKSELNIPRNAKIIGHVGSISKIKNQPFMLKVLSQFVKENKEVYLVLAGDGELRGRVEEEARQLGLKEHIRLLGVRDDIPRLMKAFDVFLFPSLYEGFGIVTLEAQCAGTPCLAADTVPRTTDMGLGLIDYVSLEAPITEWVEVIKQAFHKSRPQEEMIFQQIKSNGYDIQGSVSDWLALYGVS